MRLNRADIATTYAKKKTGTFPKLIESLKPREQTLLQDLESNSVRELAKLYKRHDLPLTNFRVIDEKFIDFSGRLAKHINDRWLGDLDLAAVFMDGTPIGPKGAKSHFLWAIGVTVEGQKAVLGYKVCNEHHEEVLEFLDDLVVTRGLDLRHAIVETDGGGGAIKATGMRGLVRGGCTVHKARVLVRDHVINKQIDGRSAAFKLKEDAERFSGAKLDDSEVKKGVRTMLYQKLGEIWDQETYEKAKDKLKEVESWLLDRGLDSAAKSLMNEAEASLLMQRLKIPREIWRQLRTTNAIESAHRMMNLFRGKPTNWKAKEKKGHSMPERFFAAAATVVEVRFGRLGNRKVLEKVQLAKIAGHYPAIEISARNKRGRLELKSLAPRDGKVVDMKQARGALADLLVWADWGARRIEVAGNAFERFGEAGAAELREWCADHGFVVDAKGGRTELVRPNEEQAARAAEAAAETRKEAERDTAVDAGRSPPSLERLAGVSQIALGLSVEAMGWSRDDLEKLAATVEATERALGEIEPRLGKLSENDRNALVEDLARSRLEGVKPDPLTPELAVALGAGRADDLDARAARRAFELQEARRGALSEGRPDQLLDAGRRRMRLSELDPLAARVEAAARAKAAARELRRLEFVAAAAARDGTPHGHWASPMSKETLATNRKLLGDRAESFDAGVAAIRAELEKIAPDERAPFELQRLHEAVGNPWAELDNTKASRLATAERKRTSAQEARKRLLEWQVEEKVKERNCEDHWTQAHNQKADEHGANAERQRLELAEAYAGMNDARKPTVDDSKRKFKKVRLTVHEFLDAHPEAAMHAAIQHDLHRREERALEQLREGNEAGLPELRQEPTVPPAEAIGAALG